MASLDEWKRVVDLAGIVLLLVAFFLALAGWKIGNKISARDDVSKRQLEAKVLEAERALAPRHLEPDKRRAMVEYLRTTSKPDAQGRSTLVLLCLGPIAEPCLFADEIKSALDDGGWSVPAGEYHRGGEMSGVQGVLIRGKDPHSLDLLKNTLRRGGIFPDVDNTWGDGKVVMLVVGYKKSA